MAIDPVPRQAPPEWLAEAGTFNEGLRALPPLSDRFRSPDGLATLRATNADLARRLGDAVPDEVTTVARTAAGCSAAGGRGGSEATSGGAARGDGAGEVPVRIFHHGDGPRAVYLEMHGGGWTLGPAAMSDFSNRALQQECGIAVVSVDYRLAPEHPHPAALVDCTAVAAWLLEHAAARFGTTRLILGGGSAGATLAVLTLLWLRDHHPAALTRVAGIDLRSGLYDLSMTPSQRAAHDGLVIDRAYLESMHRLVYPGRTLEELRSPAISPLYADLTGLPPALFTVGDLDPFLDDSLFLAARWAAAGNTADLDVHPCCPHGFEGFPTALAAAARARIHTVLRRWATTPAPASVPHTADETPGPGAAPSAGGTG